MGALFEIFTDAACRNNNKPSVPSEASSAAILCFNKKPIKYFGKYWYDRTNNWGEINAILLGIVKSFELFTKLESVKPPYLVDLYSDSEFCVKGLNHWYKNWIDCLDSEGKWLNSSGNRVINQEVFADILKIKKEEPIKINILHIKGHVPIDNEEKVQKAIKLFKINNGFEVNREEIIRLIEMNHLVDQLANKIVDAKHDYDRVLMNINKN